MVAGSCSDLGFLAEGTFSVGRALRRCTGGVGHRVNDNRVDLEFFPDLCGHRLEILRCVRKRLKSEQFVDLFGLAEIEPEDDFTKRFEILEEVQHLEQIGLRAFLRIGEVEKECALLVRRQLRTLLSC